MKTLYTPLEESGRQDPPADATNDESTRLPDRSVEEFRAEPAVPSEASSSLKPSEETSLRLGESPPLNVLEDLLQGVAAQQNVTQQSSAARAQKKRRRKRKDKTRKGSIGSKNSSFTAKKKADTNRDDLVTAKDKPKSRPAERDVLLTSVHIKPQEDMDISASTAMSEITTPVAIRPKSGIKSNVVLEHLRHDKIDEDPASPTEQDLTDSSTNNKHEMDKVCDGKNEPQKRMRSAPSLTSEDSKQNLLVEQVAFAIALPKGPCGISVKNENNRSVVSNVNKKSPVLGIVVPGLIVVGLHLPGDGAEQPESTMANLRPDRLYRVLRESSKQNLRLLWLTKDASGEFSNSWLSSMSSLWMSNHQVRTFAATKKKTLVSVPSGDLGISLRGKPPRVYNISSASPLQGLEKSGDGSTSKLYVKSLYCAETGDRWTGKDAHELSEALRSTSQQQMRILVVSQEKASVDDSEGSFSPSFHSAGSLSRSRMGFVAEESKDKRPESPRRKKSARLLTIQSSKRNVGSSVRKTLPSQHIIVKKSTKPSGLFSLSRVHAFAFHGASMDEDLAKVVQTHLDEIDTSPIHALKVVRDGSHQSESHCFVATMSPTFQKRHEEDALVAIMDAMASAGWALQCPTVYPRSRGGNDVMFVFAK